MMRRKQNFVSKRLKKFSDVRVVNPQEYHCAPIEPRQGFRLVITPPEKTDEYPNPEIKINCSSPFFVPSGMTVDKNGRNVYYFVQKYEIPTDQDIACGSITTKFVNSASTKSSTVILYYSGKHNSVRCYNPDEITVRLEPHQILSVHISEPGFENAGWKSEFDSFNQNLNYEMIHASFGDAHKFSANPFLDKNSLDAISLSNTLTDSGNKSALLMFVLDKNSSANTTRLSGSIFAGRLILTGTLGEITRTRFINIFVKISGSKKKLAEFPSYNREKLTTRGELVNSGVFVLTNPGDNETIDLQSGVKSIVVEMIQPSAIWSQEPSESIWEIYPDTEFEQQLDIIKKPDISRWGGCFQQWEISPKIDTKSEFSTFAGACFLRPVGKPHLSRRLSVWCVPTEPKQITAKTYNKTSTSTSSFVNTPFSHDAAITAMRRAKKSNYTYPGKVAVCQDLKLVKIDSKSLMEGVAKAQETVVKSFHDDDYHGCVRRPHVVPVSSPPIIPAKITHKDNTYHFDPADGSLVFGIPGSNIVFRFPCTGENLWFLQVIDDSHITVSDSKVTKNANGENFVSFTINVSNDTARDGATAGVFRVSDGTVTKTISIRSTRDGFLRRYVDDTLGTLVKSERPSSTSTGKVVKSFKHNECLVVKPNELAYVKLTDQKHGSLNIIQHRMPDLIWHSSELSNVRDKINQDRAWIQSIGPSTVCRTLTIRSFESQNPFARQIIKAASGRVEPVLVAEFVFEHEDYESGTKVDTPFGTITRKTTITKVLKYFIDFSEDKSNWRHFSLPFPVSSGVVVGDKISVRLKKRDVEIETDGVKNTVSYPWFVNENLGNDINCQFIKSLGLRKENGDFVFEFVALAQTLFFDRSPCQGTKDGTIEIDFCCGMHVEKLKLIINPSGK